MATIFIYLYSQHVLPQCKCVLSCCVNCPNVDITSQESDKHHSNTCPKIRFHVLKMLLFYTAHVRHTLDEKYILCCTVPLTVTTAEIYTIKELVMMEKYISGFYISLHILVI